MDDFNRGIVYQEKAELDQAIASYTKAIAILPQYADVYYQRGLAYFAQGDYKRAIEDYNQALKINPLFVDAYMKNNEGMGMSLGPEYRQCNQSHCTQPPKC